MNLTERNCTKEAQKEARKKQEERTEKETQKGRKTNKKRKREISASIKGLKWKLSIQRKKAGRLDHRSTDLLHTACLLAWVKRTTDELMM
mmetsp:Transcript_31474/g.62196  ORF Transcript_31474/g.62196 Transcript_31474/m.62196 type:complete len:90 (-) Transcript_31474:1-270(-)